jgi:hypothetical protein
MALSSVHLRRTTCVLSLGRHRATRYFAGLVVAAASLLGATMPAVAATSPTLAVVVLGSGRVTSQPAGIACPGKCTATFVAGTAVALTPQVEHGSTFLGWGGSCAGTGVCKLKVTSLTAVAAEFSAGATTPSASGSWATPGPYSGSNGQDNEPITFYMAAGGKSILNVMTAGNVSCTPSGETGNEFETLQIAIKPNGSFMSKAVQEGVFGGSSAKYTYTIQGQFQRATATAAASAAGTWREDVVVATGSTTSCTSNLQAWTATLYREPPQTKAVVKTGDYSGNNGEDNEPLTFSVQPGGTSMLNVTTAGNVYCLPSGETGYTLAIPKVTIMPNGSFTAKTSLDGVFGGVNSKVTFTFEGYFEGPTPAGAATVAGIWREDIVPTSGTTTMCTSNDASWTATLQS